MSPELLEETNNIKWCIWTCEANPGGIELNMILKWVGTITVLVLMNLAVGARAQSVATAYRLSVKIHGGLGSCGNDELGSQELYVVVKRLDWEL